MEQFHILLISRYINVSYTLHVYTGYIVLGLSCNVCQNVTKTVRFIRFVKRVLTRFSYDSEGLEQKLQFSLYIHRDGKTGLQLLHAFRICGLSINVAIQCNFYKPRFLGYFNQIKQIM